MKNNIFKQIFLALTFLMSLTACENDGDLVTFDLLSAPKIVELSADKIYLDGNFPKNPVLTVVWDAAKYSAPTEVKYVLEASSSANFTTFSNLTTLDKSVRFAAFTNEQINAAAANIGLEPNIEGDMYLRVTSYLGSNALSATSEVTSIKITPYKLSFPDFYIVGEASYVGWDAGNSQAFYKKDNMSYIYTFLDKDKNFRFLGQQDWNPINYSIDADGIRDAYKYFKQVSSNIKKADGDEENMRFTGASGIYKVSIDATTGVQALTASVSPIIGFDFTELYIVGNVNGNGWSADNAISMTKTGAGIFEYTATLAADAEFKFIGQKSWGDLEWGNILTDNNGYSEFLGPKGDNSNIKFTGDGGNYKITVNLKAGTYKIIKN